MRIDEIKKLPHKERLAITEEIWDGLDKDLLKVPQSQIDEVRRRLLRVKEGKSGFTTWDQIKKRLHSKGNV